MERWTIDYRSKTCSLENALKAQERFDVVIDTVSSADSRDQIASYPSKIAKLKILKSPRQNPVWILTTTLCMV